MNCALIPPGEPSAPPLQPAWRQRLEEWRTFLAQCGNKPSRKSVHALRALTLRLQVEMEHSLPEQAENFAAERAFQRWNKDAKKLRKVLGPVRDADVYLMRLDDLRDSLAIRFFDHIETSRPRIKKKTPGENAENQAVQATSGGNVLLSARCTREIDKMENRLRRKRLAGIEKLVAVLDEHGKRLSRLSNEMEAAFAPYMSVTASLTAQATLKIIAGLTDELPRPNAANLHEYRKRLKPALYLAEISAAADPLVAQQAIAFRKIHDAVGEWHDWQELAREANRIFPHHGKPDGLVSVLEALAKKALHRALGQCRRSAARSAKEMSAIQLSWRKKPVVTERGVRLEEEDSAMEICR
jgi:CHAD domain-containing protein